MERLKKLLLNEYMLVFLFCLAVIHGPAFSLMDNFNQSECIDCQTYLGLAQGNLDQSPVRRYRPIVPAMAGIINYTCGPVFNVIKPLSFPGDFPLSFSFYLVNCLLLSIWGVLIYRYCKAYGLSPVFSLAGLLVMLSCRWTPYMAGTPMADSIYCLVLGMVLLGIKEKKETLILLAILLGPFAKEAFIFIAPIVFFCSHVPKVRQLLYFGASGILVFSFRYAYDHIAGMPPGSGLAADLYHFSYIKENIHKFFSFHGIYDLLSNFGLWLIFPFLAWGVSPAFSKEFRQRMDLYIILFMCSLLIHMLLSGFFERMMYLAMPVICMVTGLAMQKIKEKLYETLK